jgi:hypothetical protein
LRLAVPHIFAAVPRFPDGDHWYEDVDVVDGVPPFPDVHVTVSTQVLHYISVDEVHLFVLVIVVSDRGELNSSSMDLRLFAG